jgi:hypothetical protein
VENEAIRTEEYRGFKIKFFQDMNPESPRENDNIGKMVCFHKRYDLGDKHDLKTDNFGGWNEIQDYLIKELNAVIIHPLRLYDHSGITISMGNSYPYNDQWDSMMVGFIYVDKDTLKKEYCVKNVTKLAMQKAEKYIAGEVDDYDKYLRGDVYGYVIVDADGEELDSCWGIYGGEEDTIKECQEYIDATIKASNESKHYPKVEVFVTKTLKFRARIRESVEVPSYEVSIGGEEWSKGKGINHREKIVGKMSTIMSTLESELGQFFNGRDRIVK